MSTPTVDRIRVALKATVTEQQEGDGLTGEGNAKCDGPIYLRVWRSLM